MSFYVQLAIFVALAAALVAVIFTLRNRQAAQRAASLPNLVGNPPPAPAGSFTRRSLEGIGTIEWPSGPEWEGTGNQLYNDKLGLVLLIQNQIQSFGGREQAYLESYNQVNLRDAPNWERGPEQVGQVGGMAAASTSGRFHNGTPMVTRDYLFFAAFTTVLLQSRVPASHADALAITDYLASTFRR